METIRGKRSLNLDFDEFRKLLKRYRHAVLDLGTGDGRYVRDLAVNHPDWLVVGVDACRENLRDHSRAKLPNMLFIIACAQELPGELEGAFSLVAINFPWGSLLKGLLTCEPGLMRGLTSVSRPGTQLEIRLNSGALVEAGTGLDTGTRLVDGNLNRHGWSLGCPRLMDQEALAKLPTTWARRLAHGRAPLAMSLSGKRALG